MTPISNALFYGDCLHNLRKYVGDETVDGCYLDPPFNSDANYNRPFQSKEKGKQKKPPAMAFHDMWHWDEAAQHAYERLLASPRAEIVNMARGVYLLLGEQPMTAYCFYMAERLLEIHRVLKPTGSVYLHCDPTASHYLKVIMDAIFGEENFRNEIVWFYRRWAAASNQYQRMHDTLLFYSKTQNLVFNTQYVARKRTEVSARGYSTNTYNDKGVRQRQIIVEDREVFDAAVANGEIDMSRYSRVVDRKAEGTPAFDVFEIPVLNSQAKERLGYPTQKPLALLERIIKTSTNEGDVILDPFCGCGTTLHAAQKLNRRWLGMDISYGAINVVKERLQDAFADEAFRLGNGFSLYNTPTSYEEAVQLAELEAQEVQAAADRNKSRRRSKHQARYDFQNFILGQIRDSQGRLLLQPSQSVSRDGGIDGWGTLYLGVDEKGKDKEGLILVQVKTSKRIGRREIDEFLGVMSAEEATMGIFISLHGHQKAAYADVLTPEAQSRVEQVGQRTFVHPLDGRAWPVFQFWSVSDLMENRHPRLPSYAQSDVPKAVREVEETQLELAVAEVRK